jgi:hypothetical protein
MQQFRFSLSAEHLGVNIGADAAYEGLTAEEVLRPETSPILQEIAKDLCSHSAERQSRAIMRARETLSSSKYESSSASDLKKTMTPPRLTVNCSAFLIEAGIMAPISKLLRRAAQGAWLECKIEGAATVTYNWAAICANALYFLVEDMRTFRAVSASIPHLFDVLADLYLEGIETPVRKVGVLTDGDVAESKQDARQNVLQCLAHFALWSPRFRSQCARHVTLLMAILKQFLVYLKGSQFNYDTFLLLYKVFHLTDDPTLDARVLEWISIIIQESRDRSLLEGVCNFLSRITLEEGYQKRALDLSTCTVLLSLLPNPGSLPGERVRTPEAAGKQAWGGHSGKRFRRLCQGKQAALRGARAQGQHGRAARAEGGSHLFRAVLPAVLSKGENARGEGSRRAVRPPGDRVHARRASEARVLRAGLREPGEEAGGVQGVPPVQAERVLQPRFGPFSSEFGVFTLRVCVYTLFYLASEGCRLLRTEEAWNDREENDGLHYLVASALKLPQQIHHRRLKA